MSKINDGGPAFACAAENGHQAGMTLRDWFAGQALDGMMAKYGTNSEGGAALTAIVCYAAADAMLAEREKAK